MSKRFSPTIAAATSTSPIAADPGSRRLAWVDVAKGICIVMVVMMHSTLGIEKLAGETGWMGALVAFAKPFRMPDFFLISGLFLGQVLSRDWRTFLDRRVVHFAYFYLLWLTIQFAFKAPGMVAEAGALATVQSYVLAIFVEPFGTLWFIWMLPVFALAVRLTRRVPVPLMLLAGAALEIAPIETGRLVIDEFCARFVYFYGGYALSAQILSMAQGTRNQRLPAAACLALWAAANAIAVAEGLADAPGISLVLGTLGALAIVGTAALLVDVPRVGAALRFLGERSIVVYLAFFLPMAAMRTLLLHTGILPDGASMALVTTVFAVLVPLGLWWLATRFGARFLFERPRWARLRAPAAVLPA